MGTKGIISSHLLWTHSQRRTLLVILFCLLALILFRFILNPLLLSDPLPHSSPLSLSSRIDPNTADWPALAAIPNLGESRAKAIVAYRQFYLSRHPASLPFRRPDDLLRIPGIGVSTLESLSPHLLFPDASQPTSLTSDP